MYHPDTPIPVWCVKCHISDAWDARDYAKEYDFSKPFFEQFNDLKINVPHRALDQNEKNGTGCEYSNYCFGSKDTYLSFSVGGSENVKYSAHVFKGNKNCFDSLSVKNSDRVYELVQSSGSYNSSFLIESDQCIESHFLFDCSNCTNCCLSLNLRNKSNVFRNKQLSKEEYQKAFSKLKLDTYSGQLKAKEEFYKIAQNAIHRDAHIKNSVNTIGDFIENSKNVYHCYGLIGAENIKHIFFAMNMIKDSQNIAFCGLNEECYEFTYGGRDANKAIFAISCGGGCKNIFYCDSCRECSDCFGCVGLSKKQYCILNKQYSKEKYFEMIKKIQAHMNNNPYIDRINRKYSFGEFFPTEISPFAYNETVAFEEQPLSQKEAISLGYKWREPELKSYKPTIKGDDIQDSINDVADSICNEIIECPNQGKVKTQCTSAYRILPDELSFYRQMNLPIPRYCPNCRYHARLVWKNPFRFYERECMCELSNHEHQQKCSNKFETIYAPDRPELIYCKECYQKEVY
ncbi:hypothetical protein A3A95_00425 [Candidatus Nomurabacteria bacterium RIFCSPLOWO2_01_FULL_39_18]|uniref:Caib/baif family protein n=1 Tax=Candidatus Nomurabacteria bacterium RIFCSPHIGHO2_01_FULL_40_24b TaxID=1801739 RepID=A0A1F6V935_9BACT|nr:MAG: hypothetical protein A2647_03275 [Candidatus Nomurabacteria bacterium RIFCSPHIGHO2_01_FULL_40_24b]OGI90539.1 MAG: hypothetical protein A3A95_00425 [Candidatus Nomurabacteria bacterium RIFCSPLOWO2_01_FULL_39_18]